MTPRIPDDRIEAWQETIAAGYVIHPSAHGAITELLAERESLLSLLREVEWKDFAELDYEHARDVPCCIVCEGLQPGKEAEAAVRVGRANPEHVGHAPDCRLAAFLKET